MKPMLKISPDGKELSEMLANDLASIAAWYKSNGSIFRVALSGGNTPRLFFQILAENFKDKIDWNNIEFYWADERCVPADDEQSNFGMTKQTLFNSIKIDEMNINRIKGEVNPQLEAKQYSDLIARKLPKTNGLPQFDLILLGLGGDGHTASIFPDHLDLFDIKEYYAGTSQPVTGQMRITITGKVINNSKRIWFLICGKVKAGIVSAIINQSAVSSAYPASFVKPREGELVFYLDNDAASEV